MMKWLTDILKFKNAGIVGNPEPSAVFGKPETVLDERRITRVNSVEAAIRMNRMYGAVSGMTEFFALPEVFFPIDFIASRIAGAHFEIKKNSDDSIVWCANRSRETKEIARLLNKPNWLQSWPEFVYTYFMQKLATGNTFMRGAMNTDIFDSSTEKWKWCKNLWVVPSSIVSIETTRMGGIVNMFGCEDIEDVITGYRINGTVNVPQWQMFHDRDLYAEAGDGNADFLWSPSRLAATKRNITILKRVYDARNTIFDKCGALGIITNRSTDETGHVAMDATDKKELVDHYNNTYGPTDGKSPTVITDANVDYLKTGASISELQPFDETLADAIEIAGMFNIPAVLVPRKDQSTFSNQATAEKSVYTSVIIPMCKKFCENLTLFLGLKDYYISCNFDDVDCLQTGRKEEQNKKLVNDRCRQQFLDGLISYNDWRAQIHESAKEGEMFSKTLFEMTDEERTIFLSIISAKAITTTTKREKSDDEGDEKSDGDDKGQ